MYSELINNEVVIIVAFKNRKSFRISGLLCEESEESLKLKNVEMNLAILNFQKSMFGSGIGSYNKTLKKLF